MSNSRFSSDVPDSWPSPPLRAAIRESRNFWTGKRALVTGAFDFSWEQMIKRSAFWPEYSACAH